MKLNLQEKTHTFTLVGMSGSGKTSLSHKLSADGFFHYSIDYEIAHTHLKSKIKQSVVEKIAKQSPTFCNLIEKFAINLELSLTFDDLEIITMFAIPQKENGKVNFGEFLHNQELYRIAEIQATQEFHSRAKIAFDNYQVEGFINDTTGSICDVALSKPELLGSITRNSQVIYLQTTQEHQEVLIERSKNTLKPILYNKSFFYQSLKEYYKKSEFNHSFEIDQEFFLWIFPKLLEFRQKSYQEFVKNTNGKTINAMLFNKVRDTRDFLDLIHTY
ncbi:MAG: hypothetical protein ACI9CD_000951 [Candidatus Deianiraeaceae bacterium]|jgi:hypothetical protein